MKTGFRNENREQAMTAGKTLLSIAIPCYNEGENLWPLSDGFGRAIGKRKGIEVVLVDNGSKDGSDAIMGKIAKKHGFVRVVKVKENTGYGNGIWQGLRAAKGEFLGWCHADMQTPPQDIMRGAEIILGARDGKNVFVKGERRARPLFDLFFTAGMGVFCSAILGKWLFEINAQPNFFHKSFMRKLGSPPSDFSFDLYALYIAKKGEMEIIRYPVGFGKREHGESSWNSGLAAKMKFIKRTIGFTLKLRESLGQKND